MNDNINVRAYAWVQADEPVDERLMSTTLRAERVSNQRVNSAQPVQNEAPLSKMWSQSFYFRNTLVSYGLKCPLRVADSCPSPLKPPT